MVASTYSPRTYDAQHQGRKADIDWYLSLARVSGGPVLELGAGTGRITLEIARAGIAIDALDLSAEMLAALKSRITAEAADVRSAIRVFEGDMASFDLPGRYALIAIPFRSFLHNITRDRQIACLRACRAHLAPGGRLAFDIFQPSESYMADFEGDFEGIGRMDPPIVLPGGSHLLLTEWNTYDRAMRSVRSVHRHDTVGPDGAITDSRCQILDLALLDAAALRDLLTEAGFTEITLFSDFNQRPVTVDSVDIAVIAT